MRRHAKNGKHTNIIYEQITNGTRDELARYKVTYEPFQINC